MKDKAIEKLIRAEAKRQKKVSNLIASENYVSQDVLTALGSILTNKYAEGYPQARYYGGNKIIDQIETLCQKRALKLFKLKNSDWAVNVQALSGSPANLAVYLALVPFGDPASAKASARQGKIMGLELAHGGHLTHGHKVSASGKFWSVVTYGVNKETEQLDYEEIKKIALKEKPTLIIAGYTAYPRIIDWLKFREIADACGAYLMIDLSHLAGLVAGGVYPSPFLTKTGQALADVVMMTTHKTLRGPRSALIFSRIDNRELNKKIDKAVFPGIQGGPHLNQIASVAVALAEASKPEFKIYAKQTIKNAKVLGEALKKKGWRLVSGGTDSHLLLVDVWQNGQGLPGQGIGGKEASEKLEQAGIIVNKNTIPFDTRSPVDPSGIRLGTAAETTRGKKEKDMIKLAEKIDKVLKK